MVENVVTCFFGTRCRRKWPVGIKWSRDRWRHVTLKGHSKVETAGDAI